MSAADAATGADAAASGVALDTARPTDPPLGALARALAATAGLVALAVLAGWVFDVETLKQVAPALVPMAFNTAVSLLLLSASFFLPRPAAVVACALAAVIASASLAEYALGLDLHIDQLVFTDTSQLEYPGRMAGATAVCILLLAVGRALLALGQRAAAQTLGVLVLLASAVAVLGYAYGVRSLYRIGPLSTIALHTALALHVLGLALLALVPGGLLPWVVRASDAGGVLLRRLLPVALVGLPVVGWLRLRGEELGWYTVALGLALNVVVSALLVAFVAWTAARALARTDRGRLQAIAELQALTAELEDRVEERVAQIEAHHARIAVLEDRERIAADLHDLVVQRLFAAGVQLQSVMSLPEREAMRGRIDQAIDGIDAAIHDLRASILELKSGRHAQDLAGEVEATLDAAQVVLGFRPALRTEGAPERAAGVGDDVLAVLREGLANVARHARASHVEVTLRCDGEHVVLRIADDGVGLPAAVAVDSGRRNLRARAEHHGGRCEWRANRPRGTVLEWTIPTTGEPDDADGATAATAGPTTGATAGATTGMAIAHAVAAPV